MEAATIPSEPDAGLALAAVPDDGGDTRLLIGEQLTLGVGGIKPSTSTLRLMGGKVEVAGQVGKGERLTLEIDVVVVEVGFKDSYVDLSAAPVTSERRQQARIVGTPRRVESPAA